MKSKLFLIFIVLSSVFNDAMSGRVRGGSGHGDNTISEDTPEWGRVCKEYSPTKEINLNELTGVWWEVITFNHYRRMEPRSCSVSYFYSKTANSKPNPVVDDLTALFGKGPKKQGASNKVPTYRNGLFITDDFTTNDKYGKKEHNKLTWTLNPNSMSPRGGLTGTQFNGHDGIVTFRYDIIATNYKDYIFALTCRSGEKGLSDLDGGVILTREKALSKENIKMYLENFQYILANFVQIDTYSYFVHENNLCEDVDFPKAEEMMDLLFKKETSKTTNQIELA